MKCLRLRIWHSETSIHPMHEFEINCNELHGSELLYWNPSLGETNSMVFRVQGDPDVYREKLEQREETVDYSISPAENGTFYCCVSERLTERDKAYVDAFAQGTLVVVPPVQYNQDGTIDTTIVGTPSDIDTVLTKFPKVSEVEILSVSEYRTRAAGEINLLTSRQREVVKFAIDFGYYDSPRKGTVDEVADELGITPSTAAEHLRKAEAQIMPQILKCT